MMRDMTTPSQYTRTAHALLQDVLDESDRMRVAIAEIVFAVNQLDHDDRRFIGTMTPHLMYGLITLENAYPNEY